VEKKSGDE